VGRIAMLAEASTNSHPRSSGQAQKLVNTTQSTWHAQMAGGGAINETSGFTNPSAAEADRIPELELTAGGTPGTYTIVGTWNGEAQTEQITTVAGSTVKGNLPFDTITSLTGPDPVQPLDIHKGDSYADPPARWFYTGATGGNVECQLSGESAVKTITGLPSGLDWARRITRVGHDNTTISDGYFVW
jgi:hypothetical protein